VFLAWLTVTGGIAVVLALGWSLVVAGLRAGDQAGDATVTAAADAGQVAIVAVVRRLPGRRVVVTADRELRERCVAAGAEIRGPGWLLGLISGLISGLSPAELDRLPPPWPATVLVMG